MKEGEHTSNEHAPYWAKVCEEFLQRLIAYARKLANGRSYDADDLVQETVCRILMYPKNPAEVESPFGYLVTIMRNIWSTKWRAENTANTESLDELQSKKALKNHPTVEPDVFRILENEEFARKFNNLPGRWTTRERELLRLYLEGYNCKEIADMWNEDVRLVRSDLNAAKSKLHQRITRGYKKPKH